MCRHKLPTAAAVCADFADFIVCEVPSSATISSAPTTDGKQFPFITISKIYPDKLLVPEHTMLHMCVQTDVYMCI